MLLRTEPGRADARRDLDHSTPGAASSHTRRTLNPPEASATGPAKNADAGAGAADTEGAPSDRPRFCLSAATSSALIRPSRLKSKRLVIGAGVASAPLTPA